MRKLQVRVANLNEHGNNGISKKRQIHKNLGKVKKKGIKQIRLNIFYVSISYKIIFVLFYFS